MGNCEKSYNYKLVSVVIPFYSNVSWLHECVESILNQSYPYHEIIVVNDGSPEDMSDFIRIYGDKIIYIFKENRGPASARNIGIDIASGDYIAFLDSDDIWCDRKIEKQVDLMERTKTIWSHTSYSLFHDQEPHKVYKKIDLSHYQGMVFLRSLLSSPIATPCVMIKTSYLKENPQLRFAEQMRYGEDSYLWVNLAVNNHLSVVPDILTKVRVRGTNAASRARAQLAARAQLWRYISEDRMPCFSKREISRIIKAAFIICSNADYILVTLERKKVFNKTLIENLSKILYSFPYAVFKIYYNATWKNK